MSLALATAFLSFALPSAQASCIDANDLTVDCGDLCVRDVCIPGGDPCHFRSDCCPSQGVWCPEYPPE